MRCFLMRDGRFKGVEMLEPGSDENLIQQSHIHFDRRQAEGFDSFEVWDHARLVFSWPEARSNPKKESL